MVFLLLVIIIKSSQFLLPQHPKRLEHPSLQKVPNNDVFTVQVTKTSSSCSNYDSCQSEVVWHCYGSTKSAKGGGWGGEPLIKMSDFDMWDHFSLSISHQQESTAVSSNLRQVVIVVINDEKGTLASQGFVLPKHNQTLTTALPDHETNVFFSGL